ncbi:LPS O-antigen chain length determinant protein WzzB [Comamonas terrae]|uniref:LPS O-antigen chain length determinant protein WzzB n=1 Tax=Comamonas terrae TaxID=673548 RepID=A0ABW5UMR6_9BURK|nr:LPS O-antigen chain length determinant protein WzzB [Comamonas terrae]
MDRKSVTLLTRHGVISQIKSEWRLIASCTIFALAISVASLFIIEPRYEIKAYIDKPYGNEISELNIGRSAATGLQQYTPEQIFAYFTRRLTTDEAAQRFFLETYLPQQESLPETEAGKQALYNSFRKSVISISPPPLPPKAGFRDLYSIQIIAPTGEKAKKWIQDFLSQVSDDARHALIQDIEKSISLQIQNTERDLQEKMRTTELNRHDRQAQLAEALQVAQAVGLKEPQMTSIQPPRQDSAASYIDGSRLYARGTKSLQAELEVLKQRKDDAPFVEGLRAIQAQLNLLKEQAPSKKQFKIFHIDGEIVEPLKPMSPKKSLIIFTGLFFGLALGTLAALIRTGILQRFLSEAENSNR